MIRTVRTESIRSAIVPLRLVFWGGLLCVLDIQFSQTTNGTGFRFDILNDFIGMLMITTAVFRLATFDAGDRYRFSMSVVRTAAVLATMKALQAHVIYEAGPFVSAVLTIVGFFNLVATVMFCRCMGWLAETLGLARSAASWRMTTILFFWIYLVPIGLLHLTSLAARIGGSEFHFDSGPAGLLLLPVFVVPLVHLFVSTSRMKREAEWTAATPGFT